MEMTSKELSNLQLEAFREWIESNTETIDRIFNASNFKNYNNPYIMVNAAAVLFAKTMEQEMGKYSGKKLPHGMPRFYQTFYKMFSENITIFIKKYVSPIYSIATRLRREFYKKGFPK